MTQMMSKSLKEKSSWRQLPFIFFISGIAVTLLLYSGSGNRVQEEGGGIATVKIGSKQSISNKIFSGTVNDIPYYHCAGNEKHLVLLHGARFTKEDWKTSGIMGNLCQTVGLSVSAMDLPVSAGHQELKALLMSMQTEELLTLPVALVTPSASGKTITDWMTKGDVTEIPSYISKWIPVAAGAVSKLSDEHLRSLDGNLSIFAIYGSEDGMGKQVTERLASLARAETLEIERSGHACYLDSPAVFIKAVLQNMDFSA